MDDWPVIEPAELRERLAQSDDEFLAFMRRMTVSVPVREFTEELYAQALGYPWVRPASSFLLTGEVVQALGDVPPGEQEAHRRDRWPLLAFGSNGAPERLALKLAHLPAAQQRVLVTAGDLHGFDVGVSAHPSVYGSMPATLFPSPGAAVRASVLWVTTEQLVALTWTEVAYALGRLDGVPFVPDDGAAPAPRHVYAFVSRLGAHRVDGEPVALAAVSATARSAPSLTQEGLLSALAVRAFGPGETARTLVVRILEDFGACSAVLAPMLHATALPFASPQWTPFATAPGLRT